MTVPKRALRGKGHLKVHAAAAREFLLRLEKLLEQGRGGSELLPAADYLETITRLKLSGLARQRAAAQQVGQRAALDILEAIAHELAGGPQSEQGGEVGAIRAKLEEKVRGI